MAQLQWAGSMPTTDRVTRIEPGVRRILANNPSPMTGRGTCTYIVGTGLVAVIDPGPVLAEHLGTIHAALDAHERIAAIFVTHAHLDHSAAAPVLAVATGAPVYAFGPAGAGQSERMTGVLAAGTMNALLAARHGVDHGFRPDVILADDDRISMGDWSLRAHHTPGHMGNHLAFSFGDLVFSGDVVLGGSSTVIAPPDGDLHDYLRSLERLQALAARRMLPGHGDVIDAPPAYIRALRAHRMGRHRQILSVLGEGPATLDTLVARLYAGLTGDLRRAASQNVLAHLILLQSQGALHMQENAATPLFSLS